MKKYIYLVLATLIAFTSCSKKADSFDAAAQATADDASIKAYIAANNITAVKDPSGMYYQIITPGTGSNPSVSNTVQVNYTGKLLDGTIFDQTVSNSLSIALTSVIQGWQIGIPYIKPGGRILLLIPSALGYGNSSPSSKIPANSVLIFTIDLIGYK